MLIFTRTITFLTTHHLTMKTKLLSLLAAGWLLQSCQVANMAVEPDFKSQAQEMAIIGRKTFKPNSSFSLGNYQVGNVKRGWTRTSGFSIFVYENIKASQKYEFTMQPIGGEPWYIFAATKLQQKAINFQNGLNIALSPNFEYYGCYFTSPESGQWHLLTVDPGHYLARNKFEGELSNGNTFIKVTPVYKYEGHKMPSSEILGYEFWQDNTRLASVQVINNGKAWLKAGLSPDTRQVLANAMASLLLYEKLNDPTNPIAIK
jgi:hypothetical protein